MKKRYLHFALIFASILSLFLLAACDYNNDLPHTHKWSEVYANDSTNHWKTCSGCEEVQNKAAHEYGEWIEVTAATEDATGVKKHICSVCGYEETAIIEIHQHSIGEVVHTIDGRIIFKCETCKDLCFIDSNDNMHSLDRLFYSTKMYDSFSAFENGEILQNYYLETLINLLDFHYNYTKDLDNDIVYTSNFNNTISINEALAVWAAIESDWPILYWISNSVSYDSENINYLTSSVYYKGSERKNTHNLILERIDLFKKQTKDCVDNIQIIKKAYDYIIDNTNYAYDSNGQPSNELDAHSISGFFKNKNVVCEGYAKTFQILMNALSIDNCYITGKANNESHAWNYVEYNDKWYGMDVTWDDRINYSSENLIYKYFMLDNSKYSLLNRVANDNNLSNGVLYQFDLPNLSNEVLQGLVTLEDSNGFIKYCTINEAFDSMTNSSEDYYIYLYDKSNDILLIDNFDLEKSIWPNVKSITISGLSLNKGLKMPNSIETNSDVYLEKVILSYYDDSEKTLNINDNLLDLNVVIGKFQYEIIGNGALQIRNCTIGAYNVDSIMFYNDINVSTLIMKKTDAHFYCNVSTNKTTLDTSTLFFSSLNGTNNSTSFAFTIDELELLHEYKNGFINCSSIQIENAIDEFELYFNVNKIFNAEHTIISISTRNMEFLPKLSIGNILKGVITIKISGSIIYYDQNGIKHSSYIDPYTYHEKLFNIGDNSLSSFKICMSTGSEGSTELDRDLFSKDENNYVYINIIKEGNYWVSGSKILKYDGDELFIVIPEGYTEIAKGAFVNIRALSITLPSTLEKINADGWGGPGPFTGNCTHLIQMINKSKLNIYYNESLERYECDGMNLFSKTQYSTGGAPNVNVYSVDDALQILEENGYYYYVLDGVAIVVYAPSIEELVFPERINNMTYKLNNNLFYDNDVIKKVTFSNGIVEIGRYCFYECDNLKEIIMVDGLKKINYRSIGRCENLNKIIFAGTIEEISSSAFDINSEIKEIGISSNGTYYSVESGCLIDLQNKRIVLGSTNAVIPANVEIIGASAFQHVKFEQLVIPSNVKIIEEYAFYWSTIPSIEFSKGIEVISAYAFCAVQSLSVVVIPNSIKEIDGTAFGGCLLTQFDCPICVDSLDCSRWKISKITLQEGTKVVGSFFDCHDLIELIIPNSVVKFSVGNGFHGVYNLKKVYFKGTLEEWNTIVSNSNGETPLLYGAKLYILENGEFVEVNN